MTSYSELMFSLIVGTEFDLFVLCIHIHTYHLKSGYCATVAITELPPLMHSTMMHWVSYSVASDHGQQKYNK